MTTFKHGDKVKILVDHNNKPLKRPIYGYIQWVGDCSQVSDGIFTEKGMQTKGDAYTVKTSWGSGALWWSADALKHAGGVNRWAEWQKKLADYHEKHKTSQRNTTNRMKA